MTSAQSYHLYERIPTAVTWARVPPEQRIRLLIGAILTLVLCFWFFSNGAGFLNDADTLWHVAVGKDIWLTKSLPTVDAYSHSFSGEPWIAKEWLSQIILYTAFALGGWVGVSLLIGVILQVVLWQLYWPMSSRLKPILAGGVAIICMVACSDVFSARPHIIVLPVIILFVHQLWNSARAKRAPSFWLLAIMCLWANLHASFTFGFVAAFLAFLFYLHESRELRSKRTLQWVLFLALCPVASMAHPYGFESIWSTVIIVESDWLPYVTEWRAFSAPQDHRIEILLLISLMLALVSGFSTNIVAAGFICLLIHMYFTHVRFDYLLFTLAPLILVDDVAASHPGLSFTKWKEGINESALERRFGRAGPLTFSVIGLLLLTIAVTTMTLARWTPPAKQYPTAAIEAARAYGVHGNVLNYYNFGGGLIFENIPTFIDGRADRLFQNGFLPDIMQSKELDGDEILRHQIDRYDIGWSIIRPVDGRVKHLDEMPGWRRIYEDEFAVVHAAVKN